MEPSEGQGFQTKEQALPLSCGVQGLHVRLEIFFFFFFFSSFWLVLFHTMVLYMMILFIMLTGTCLEGYLGYVVVSCSTTFSNTALVGLEECIVANRFCNDCMPFLCC